MASTFLRSSASVRHRSSGGMSHPIPYNSLFTRRTSRCIEGVPNVSSQSHLRSEPFRYLSRAFAIHSGLTPPNTASKRFFTRLERSLISGRLTTNAERASSPDPSSFPEPATAYSEVITLATETHDLEITQQHLAISRSDVPTFVIHEPDVVEPILATVVADTKLLPDSFAIEHRHPRAKHQLYHGLWRDDLRGQRGRSLRSRFGHRCALRPALRGHRYRPDDGDPLRTIRPSGL